MEGASAAGSPRRRAASTGCGPVVEALEQRTFLSVAATNVGGYRLTLRDRETLYSWLKRGSLKNDLDRILHVNEYATSEQRMAAFDGRLLQHMRTRTYAPYFFKPDDADNIAQDLASHGDLAASAERRVGEATDALADPTPDTRGNSWITLALAYRYTSVVGPSIAGGNNATDYSTALIDKLGYWTRIRASSPYWDGVVDPLNTSKRAESWTKAYYLVLSAPAWTKEANTLFLFQMYKTGYTLANAERSTVANQRAAHTAGLMICARMYSFFADAAADWKPLANYWLDGEDFGNNNLRQFRPDGGHMEQSPNYAMVTTRILTNLSVLSTLQGEPWKHGRNDLLCSAFDAIYDVIDPTGSLPAIGDTYRFPGAMEIFVMPQVLFNQPSSRWGDLRPSIDDMLVLWKLQSKLDFNAPLAGADSIPSNSRGRSSNLRKSGMFVMRSGNDAKMSDTRQLLFENGPYGSSNNGGHGHFDMLNIELAGYGRTLIADPGPENYDSAEDSDPKMRLFARSTPSHNTISIDNYSHGVFKGAFGGVFSNEPVTQHGNSSMTLRGMHNNYQTLDGDPVVARSIWYDMHDTFLVIDWGKGDASHTYKTSYNINSTDLRKLKDGSGGYHTSYGGGNILVQPMTLRGQHNSLTVGGSAFTAGASDQNFRPPTTRLSITQHDSWAIFATLLVTYHGKLVPATRAEILGTPKPGGAVRILIGYGHGNNRVITLSPLSLKPTTDAIPLARPWDLSADGFRPIPLNAHLLANSIFSDPIEKPSDRFDLSQL